MIAAAMMPIATKPAGSSSFHDRAISWSTRRRGRVQRTHIVKSTKIIDVSGSEPVELKGRVPARSVVIPGSYSRKFPAGEYQVGCALIIGKRKESTDLKTSLNDALRDFNVSI